MTPLATLPLAFAVGVLTILSPCVPRIAPIVVAGRAAFRAKMAMVDLALLTELDHCIETVLVAEMADWLAAFSATT